MGVARRASFIALGVVTVVGCSLFVDAPETGPTLPETTDASVDAQPVGDGAARDDALPPPVDAFVAPCHLDQPFSGVRPLAEVNSAAHDYRPSLSADELIIVYSMSGYGVQEAHRTDRTKPFGQPVGALGAGIAGLSPDGLTLYYSLSPTTGAKDDIYRARRTNITGAWGPGVLVASQAPAALDTAADEGRPFVFEHSLFFSSDRGSDNDIYEAVMDDTGTVIDVHAIQSSGVNLTPGDDGSPVLTADGLRIYFASDRPFGKGSYDIWTATRPSRNEPFGAPVDVEELNTYQSEGPGWVSPDGCRIYFDSDRQGGSGGNTDVWFAEKPSR